MSQLQTICATRRIIYLTCSLADRWGTTVDFTTSFLNSSQDATNANCELQDHKMSQQRPAVCHKPSEQQPPAVCVPQDVHTPSACGLRGVHVWCIQVQGVTCFSVKVNAPLQFSPLHHGVPPPPPGSPHLHPNHQQKGGRGVFFIIISFFAASVCWPSACSVSPENEKSLLVLWSLLQTDMKTYQCQKVENSNYLAFDSSMPAGGMLLTTFQFGR